MKVSLASKPRITRALLSVCSHPPRMASVCGIVAWWGMCPAMYLVPLLPVVLAMVVAMPALRSLVLMCLRPLARYAMAVPLQSSVFLPYTTTHP